MRRRLILVSVAVTSMVVVAFLVPLFILVSDLARDTAITEAERDAASLARVLSVLTVGQGIEEAIAVVGEDRFVEVNGSVILEDGTVIGLPVPAGEDLALALAGSSFVAEVDGGVAVYVPVLASGGTTAVIRVFVPESSLEEGVLRSWIVLSVLGMALVAIAAWVSDRLGRSMVEPVNELADAANRMSEGDLSARVVPSGPEEIEAVGEELNRLASQIGSLLQQERETAADLAHRLRTPLTAARLSVDGLPDGPQKDRLVADLDELERTTTFIIQEARRPVRQGAVEPCDIGVVASDRATFWTPLATDQSRTLQVSISPGKMPVGIARHDVEAMLDALIENVLSHTDEGTDFLVGVERRESSVVVYVEDEGPGFVDGTAVERGESLGNSTGLGLDIVRRTVEESGGTLTIGESRTLGGAGVVIVLPILAS